MMLSLIKRQGEIALNLTAIGAFFALVITVFGGSLPPWATPLQLKNLQDQQTATAGILKSLNAALDRKECEDYVARLQRANAALERNVKDTSAEDLKGASEEVIRRIPNCSSPSP